MSEPLAPPSSVASAGRPGGVVWVGRVLSAVPILMMLFSAGLKLMRVPNVIEAFTGKFGYPPETIVPIGIAELACAVLYAVPRTSVLGAILMTAYLGGAVATHVRVRDVFVAPIILGIIAWLGLYLRDQRLRVFLPLRRPPP